jgi:hypothetical protein
MGAFLWTVKGAKRKVWGKPKHRYRGDDASSFDVYRFPGTKARLKLLFKQVKRQDLATLRGEFGYGVRGQ